uniref:NADH-ubiquinone oxidoreductase chain 5 n=1 Tax=Cyrtodactylus auribalteatus TaxID=2002801 RepID=A0A3G9DMF4_9SAUR|nr:NADH dehydrogenase subunit 5 [Cyrtodactylus auribalteatus]
MLTLVLHTTMTMTALTLLMPVLCRPLTTQPNISRTMKLATTMSLLPTLIFLNFGVQSITTNLHYYTTTFSLHMSLMFDTYTMLFLPVALLITSTILDFTGWYMASDPHLARFAKYLLLFLIAMATLVTANNMLQLLIGWEGVGIMSFLLIGWWHARMNANTSALQAIVYNRIGDIGLIMAMAWLATNYNTWEMQLLFSHQQTPTLPLLGLILAATGKSAQFGLHPWLPAAMEGPTPVSALLHSSTMVVAGIFLLIRLHPLLATSPIALSSCLCLGALTTLFAALCALTQNDIKKIIAFSTSSQLGLMMLTIGMNQPELAFLHITTHAFFKAMLFLCSGSIIHCLNDEQDIRKMGGAQKTLPIPSSCLTLGSLALAGTPFLAGFYTKDTIIETMCSSPMNAWALLVATLATALTAAYSTRLIYYTHLCTPRHTPTTTLNEAATLQTRPILTLATGSIVFGLMITTVLLPSNPQTMTMPPQIKFLALGATLLGLTCMLDLMQQTATLTVQSPALQHTATTQLMFFNTTTHRLVPKKNMATAQTLALQLNDLLWYQAAGPMMLKTTNSLITSKMSTRHTSNIKTHLALLTVFTMTCLMWTKLRHS